MDQLLKEAIAGLGINVPIYRTEQQDDTLILYLYGGRVVRWPPSQMATTGAGDLQDPVTTPLPPPPSPIPVRGEMGEGASRSDGRGEGSDFTAIPYVGDATAKALTDAGYLTFPDLIAATDTALLDVPKLNTYTLTKIRDYLSNHFT